MKKLNLIILILNIVFALLLLYQWHKQTVYEATITSEYVKIAEVLDNLFDTHLQMVAVIKVLEFEKTMYEQGIEQLDKEFAQVRHYHRLMKIINQEAINKEDIWQSMVEKE